MEEQRQEEELGQGEEGGASRAGHAGGLRSAALTGGYMGGQAEQVYELCAGTAGTVQFFLINC